MGIGRPQKSSNGVPTRWVSLFCIASFFLGILVVNRFCLSPFFSCGIFKDLVFLKWLAFRFVAYLNRIWKAYLWWWFCFCAFVALFIGWRILHGLLWNHMQNVIFCVDFDCYFMKFMTSSWNSCKRLGLFVVLALCVYRISSYRWGGGDCTFSLLVWYQIMNWKMCIPAGARRLLTWANCNQHGKQNYSHYIHWHQKIVFFFFRHKCWWRHELIAISMENRMILITFIDIKR